MPLPSGFEFSALPLNPYSLGMVSEYISRFHPFAEFELAKSIRAVSLQLSTGQNLVLARNDEIAGYLGWLHTTDEIADGWIAQEGVLMPTPDGDVIVITILAVSDAKLIGEILRHAKRSHPAKRIIWRRYFPDSRQSQIREINKSRSKT